MDESITRPTIMEVDLKAFDYNIKKIKEYIGENVIIIPVIKSNGYGTYINKCISVLNKFDIVAVATVDEGKELRKIGFKKEILILNQPFKDEIEKINKYNLTIGLSSKLFLEELGMFKGNFNIHIEIETGMGRTGINVQDIENFIKKIKEYKNINIEGIYTHLSSADSDIQYTKKQLKIFDESVSKAKDILGELKYIHALASNGILNFNNRCYNSIRPGIIMYGYKSSSDTLKKIDLKPITKLKSKIVFIKSVENGFSIGYGRNYITTKETKIATIPIGYADGLKRELSNKGFVLINGMKAPIIGNVCMDSIMVDITDIEAKEGDDVHIWDNKIIKLEDIAYMCNTINYEILSTISDRVPRVFI